MNPETVPPEVEMMKLILAKWVSQPIHAAATLGLADLLADGPRQIDELAESAGVLPDPLYRLLRCLASVGIFRETEAHTFANTPMSTCLQQGRLRSAAIMFNAAVNETT